MWQDDRLAFRQYTNKTTDRPYCVDSKLLDKLWRPDIFFVDSKQQRRHNVIRDNLFLDVRPSGEMMVSERLTVKLSCFMNYRMFPFDSQVCPILIESYAYRDYQMLLHWRDNDPIQFNPDLQLAEFTLGVFDKPENNLTIYLQLEWWCAILAAVPI